jgi:heme-degrading monooxygenase HmoA
MYVIVWEYQVKAEYLEDFEKIYGAGGAWADLFQRENGYLGTELLYDPQNPQGYITIDRWVSSLAYDNFLVSCQEEYELLDEKCNKLTERETLLGKWETIDLETR